MSDSLLSIIRGVDDAQAEDGRGNVHPSARGARPSVGVYPTYDGRIAFAVEFDVAVTINEGDSSEGGGKISVASLASIGGNVATTTKAETVSRLKFGVPIAFSAGTGSTSGVE